MLENKEHGFKVEKLDKTWTICKRDGSEVKKITQPAVDVTFTCQVGYGHVRSFNSYYGSQPCYDDEYAGETDYDYKVDFDDLSKKSSTIKNIMRISIIETETCSINSFR